MKQLTQNMKSGELRVEEVPPPSLKAGGVLVKNYFSLISAGTEKSKVDLGKMSLWQKAKARPEDVKKVLAEVRTNGLFATYKRVMSKLDAPSTLGYSTAGVVLAVDSTVDEFKPGDRVACAGAGYATHADIIVVPKNLCAKVPEDVGLDEAAYTTLGAIAMQGVRQTQPTLGETVVVIGLGLVGQLTVQILKAAGCKVIGVDIDPQAVNLAREVGVDLGIMRAQEDVKGLVSSFTNGYGADAVIITAATESNDPVELAGTIARDRARVIMVGAVGMNLPRGPYYMKELEFKLSRSYGPGRYDSSYEEGGNDYPIGYVRWTERRNMEEFLHLVAEKKVDVRKITTHRFNIDDAPQAYALISGEIRERYVGILLKYDELSSTNGQTKISTVVSLKSESERSFPSSSAALNMGFIGAGSFAQSFLLPALKNFSGVRFIGVCNASGISAKNVGAKFGFEFCTSNSDDIVNNESIGTVFIATRHNLHAPLVVAALKKGKRVFVEKPLALNEEELQEIVAAYNEQLTAAQRPILMVGFNRRFAPLVVEMKNFFRDVREPLVVNYRVNAGFIPKEHWTQHPIEGGGRIIGEVCHFVDTMQYLCASEPVKVYAASLSTENHSVMNHDNLSITMRLKNGSLGIITYLANGDKAVPKERIEVSSGNRSAILDNFQRLHLFKDEKEIVKKSKGLDKGHRAEVEAFMRAIQAGQQVIEFHSLVVTTRTTFKIVESLAVGDSVVL
jgi:polar amino acid transport system substrate-binding protein